MQTTVVLVIVNIGVTGVRPRYDHTTTAEDRMGELHLSFLGAFHVTYDGQPCMQFRSQKVRALLAYLAVEAHRAHERATLAGLLWPELPDEAGLRNLSQTLVRLRQAIHDEQAQPSFLCITRQHIQFNPDSLYHLDVATFIRLAETRTPVASAEACASLERAVALYQGAFLPGFALPDCEEFEAWLLLKREYVQRLALEALGRLTEAYLEAGDYALAQTSAYRQLELDGWLEAAHRQLMRALALGGQRGAALAQYDKCRRVLLTEFGVAPAAETTALYEQIQAGALASAPLVARWQGVIHSRPDWGDMPDAGRFYGRQAELATLMGWLLEEGCRLVGVVGIGGVGKTALVVRVVQAVATHFHCTIWCSVLNAPPLAELLPGWLQVLSASVGMGVSRAATAWPARLEAQLEVLVEYLRQGRCLLVLDNLESLLHTGEQANTYRPGYEEYGQLVQRIVQARHQSHLLLTSREVPVALTRLERQGQPVRMLALRGVDKAAGQAILSERGLTAADEIGAALVERYSGNPLALRLVAETIHDLFGEDTAAFLRHETLIFEDIRAVLDQQFARLSGLEREILTWLAIEREAVSIQGLQGNLVHPVARWTVLEAVRSLQRRSLLEARGEGVTLQNVVIEYVTDRLVEQVCAELERETVDVLARYALLKAGAKDYIRQSQERLLLQPVVRWLAAHRGATGTEALFRRLLDRLRTAAPRVVGAGFQSVPTYAAGNLLNLLLHAGYEVRGYDFSYLSVWQAYLRGASVPEVNLCQADLTGSVFTDTFSSIQVVAFSPDGQRLAAGAADGAIRLWQVSGQPSGIYHGHPSYVWSIAFSPAGQFLASSGEDEFVHLWDIRTGQIRHTLRGHTGWIKAVAFSPDGATLASGGWDQTVRLWDVHTGQCIHTLHGHINAVTSLAFNPAGTILASASNDHTVRVWDVHAKRLRHILLGHTNSIRSVAFSPDGMTLASGANDQTVRLWNARAGQALYTLRGYTNLVRSVAFSPDGMTLASGGWSQAVHVWNACTGQTLHTLHGHANTVRSVAFSPDGTVLASGGDDYTVRVWEVRTGQAVHILHGHTKTITAVAFRPDGMTLASGANDQVVHLWDIHTGQVLRTLHGHTGWIESLACSADGVTLASGGWDQGIRLWNTHTGDALRTLHGHTNTITSVTFSPNGAILASASNDQTVRLWDTRTGEALCTLHGHTGWVWSVAFSPDSSTLASGSYDETVKLWDVRSGACLRTLWADGPYKGMRITGTTGLTEAQTAALRILGATEDTGAMAH
jgi:WD40 repeat protein/DNA-binding SARP family transcriptional activator